MLRQLLPPIVSNESLQDRHHKIPQNVLAAGEQRVMFDNEGQAAEAIFSITVQHPIRQLDRRHR